MAENPKKNPVGPPKKPIDWKVFEKLCGLQCTQSEIASFLELDDETVSIRVFEYYNVKYPLVYKWFSDKGKCSLRRYQFLQSEKSAAMGIWLGKQWLGQKDHQEPPASPNDAILNFADAYVKSEAKRIALENQIKVLQDQLNATQPKTDPVLLGS